MRSRLLTASPLVVLALLTVGCGSDTFFAPSPTTTPVHLNGKVHGGQNPVVGARVYVYAVWTRGYGGPSVSLLGPSPSGDWPTQQDSNGNYYVTTDANGSFAITGDYSCTSGQQVYLYATGGNPGSGTNSSDGFLSLLGSCPSSGDFSSTLSYVFVNEITTVAAAYAMAGYATDATHVSTSGTALAQTGIANAFANFGNLVDITTGTARTTTPAGNGTVPAATIITLANILSTCVNSADTTGANPVPSNSCDTLFHTVTAPNGDLATDTATEAIYIAHNPGYAVAALYNLVSATAPFAGGLTTQPNDFSLTLSFTDTHLSDACYLAIDANGDPWVADGTGNRITELNSLGAVTNVSSAPSLTEPFSVSIAPGGNIWVGTSTNDGIFVFDANGNPASSAPYTDSGQITSVFATTFDTAGDAWVSSGQFPGKVAKLDGSGNQVPGGLFHPSGMNSPNGSAMDSAGNIWIAGADSQQIYVLNANLQPMGASPFNISTANPVSIAMDTQNNAWVAEFSGAIDKYNLSSSASAPVSSYFSTLSPDSFSSLAVDGSGNIWTASFANNYILELNNSGVPVSGTNLASGILNQPESLAFDGSGDLWMTSYHGATVYEMVGIATPVVTPVVANLLPPYSHPASRP